MQEYMLLIHNTVDSKSSFTPEKHLEFVNSCKDYIGELSKAGKLIAAQPLIREGYKISNNTGSWQEENMNTWNTMQVGYYHILANDMEDAVAIAKGNPEFTYTNTASIEVRPIKMKEERNQFVYPK